MQKNILLGGVVAIVGVLAIMGLGSTGEPENPEPAAPSEATAASLPSNLPANIPLYPEATVTNTSNSTASDSHSFSISLSTKASISEVNNWYHQALNQNGWTIKSDKTIGGYRIIQSENSNLYTSMQAARGSKEGEVTISQQVKVRQ